MHSTAAAKVRLQSIAFWSDEWKKKRVFSIRQITVLPSTLFILYTILMFVLVLEFMYVMRMHRVYELKVDQGWGHIRFRQVATSGSYKKKI